VAWIVWENWQRTHVSRRHGVTKRLFDQAWHDPGREELAKGKHKKHGPYYRSIGSTEDGRIVEMVWRYQDQDEASQIVWPITAYFHDEA